MCFRIDCDRELKRVVLRVHGVLVGWEAEQVLREELIRASAEDLAVVVDLSEVNTIDSGCLAAIQTGVVKGAVVEGGRAYVKALMGR